MNQPDMYDSYSSDLAANPPLKEGQVYDNGKVTTVGKYNVQIRNAYMYYRVQRYLIDHPGSTLAQAGKAARSAWRSKANASMKASDGSPNKG